PRPWAVRVVAHLGRKIEGGGEPRLPRFEEVVEAAVRLLRGSEAGVLPHGPEPSPIHGRLDASGVRVLAGEAELFLVVGFPERVERGELDAAGGRKPRLAQRARLLRGLRVHLARPPLERRPDPSRAAGHLRTRSYRLTRPF